MKPTSAPGGSGFGPYSKGEQITDISNLCVGDLLLEHSVQFNANNVVRVTHVDPHRDIFYGTFEDPETEFELRIGATPDGFAVWGFEMIDGGSVRLWKAKIER